MSQRPRRDDRRPAHAGGSASAQQAGELFDRPEVRAVLVCEDGSLTGIVTRKTLVREVVARGRDPRTTLLRDIAEEPLFTLDADAELDEAFHGLEERDPRARAGRRGRDARRRPLARGRPAPPRRGRAARSRPRGRLGAEAEARRLRLAGAAAAHELARVEPLVGDADQAEAVGPLVGERRPAERDVEALDGEALLEVVARAAPPRPCSGSSRGSRTRRRRLARASPRGASA